MSWSLSRTGRASKMSEVIADHFKAVQGCPAGSAEEQAKNALGDVAAVLCQSLKDNPVVQIEASGSAWNDTDGARSQQCSFKLSSLYGDFIE